MILTEEEYSRELAKDKAERLGLDCIFPENNQLFLDLDTEEAFATFLAQNDLLVSLGFPNTIEVIPSKSGLPHRHVILTLTVDLDKYIRIALQAVLGSDLRRELLSIDAAFNGVEQPVALFKVKENNIDKETS